MRVTLKWPPDTVEMNEALYSTQVVPSPFRFDGLGYFQRQGCDFSNVIFLTFAFSYESLPSVAGAPGKLRPRWRR